MHTSSGVDNIDEYLETVVKKGDGFTYSYGAGRAAGDGAQRSPCRTRRATGMAQKDFTVYRTHHGPIVREADGKWVSVRLMQEPLKALTQSYTRTKAKNYKAFRETMELHTNSSNNTIYADADGTIAYFHSNFIPKRDPKFDWTKPVDGSDPATEWNGVLSIDETPGLLNPARRLALQHEQLAVVGGRPEQPEEERTFPPTWSAGSEESPRGIPRAPGASRTRRTSRSTRSIAAAYDSYLPAFEVLMPSLLKAWDRAPAHESAEGEAGRADRAAAGLGLRWSVDVGADVARGVLGREERASARRPAATTRHRTTSALQSGSGAAAASDKLAADFGTWKTPWGDINRFQRLTGDIVQPFSDARAEHPGRLHLFAVGLAGVVRRAHVQGHEEDVRHQRQQLRRGGRVRRPRAGQGGHGRRRERRPGVAHFNDQAERYSTGDLRDVYFTRPQLEGHIERQYHPGNDETCNSEVIRIKKESRVALS